MAELLHHFGSGVVVLIYTMAKAHQAEWVPRVLGAGNENGDLLWLPNLFQHMNDGLVQCHPRAADLFH